jgi:hypothetical protein
MNTIPPLRSARRPAPRAGLLRTLALLGLAAAACQSSSTSVGPQVAEARTVPAFQRIELEDTTRLVVQVGGPLGMTVRGPADRLTELRTEVVDGTLRVYRAPGDDWRGGHVAVTVPVLESLAMYGSGDARVLGLEGGALRIDLVGSGDLRATGRVDRLEAVLSGSGKLDLAELEARQAALDLTGSGDAVIHATEVMEAIVSGSGDLSVRGDPPVSRLVRPAAGPASLR